MRNEILKLLETDSRLTVKDIAADDCCDSLCLLFVTEIK
jgi:hypothetical protein